jgi:hypothetical protein
VDKRPPYFKFKTAFKMRLNETNTWSLKTICNNQTKQMKCALSAVVFPRKAIKSNDRHLSIFSSNMKMSNLSKLHVTSRQTS